MNKANKTCIFTKQGAVRLIILASVTIGAAVCLPNSLYSATPPTTSISIDASATMGNDSWYTSAVPITLTAIPGTSPVESITYWLDSNTPTTVTGSTATVTLIQQGQHILNYYATGTDAAVETTKTFSHKIDLVAPGNWNTFTMTNSGNSHTFTITTKVSDKTSGIDNTSAEFQYSVDDGVTWGYYSNLTQCSSTWNNNQWRATTMTPNTAGTLSVTINIPSTDYCNSNWANTKYLRVRVKDMAGLLVTKQYALMASWLQTSGGDVYSLSNIDMTTENASSVTGIPITSGSSINNMTSTQSWNVKNYQEIPLMSYSTYYNKLISAATTLPTNLPTTSGVYSTTDKNVSSGNIPAALSTTQNMALIILIFGDLFIDSNITLHPTSSITWIASGDIGIRNSVTRADGNYISGGTFSSSYNGGSSNQLTITGMVVSVNGIEFPRSLNGTSNSTIPAEIINANPGVLVNYQLLNLLKVSSTTSWKEVINR